MNRELPIYAYLEQRLRECGIDPDKNRRTVADLDGKVGNYPILSADEKRDAINITYTYITGDVIPYEDGNKIRDFARIRYREQKEYEDSTGKKSTMKYWQPSGTPIHIYFPPQIVELYKKTQKRGKGRPVKVKTLYIVEGELKSLAASNYLNLPFIGIGGIHNFKDSSGTQLNEELREAINTLKPENIVLLFDADCLYVKYDEKKNLAERPTSFYNAVIKFRELLKEFSVDFYFGHVQTKYLQVAKGLDDLLNLPDVKRDEVREDLERLSIGEKKYMSILFVDPGKNKNLMKYFAIDSASNFYDANAAVIGEKTFNYRGSFYNFDGEKLNSSLQSQIDRYIVVGNSFYKTRFELTKDGGESEIVDYEKTDKSRVLLDLKGDTKALYKIPLYDFFANYPDNTENYKRIMVAYMGGQKCTYFNKYQKVTHIPIEGSWKNIERFLRHIFSEKNTSGESLYEFGLDFIQRLFYSPFDKLPILVLASTERGTGKTTFAKFMNDIFQKNAITIGNTSFNPQFTTLYAEKLLICFDEDINGIDKREMQEYIKNLTTSDLLKLEAKGENAKMIDNNLHFIMTTNRETNFISIAEDENRFAVLRVSPFEKNDPLIREKCQKEIPYFLYFLKNREYKYPERKNRFYFDPKVYETETLLNVKERTASLLGKEFRVFMRDYFITHNLTECEMAAVDILAGVTDGSRIKTSKTEIMDYLKYDMKKKPAKTGRRYKMYRIAFDPISGTETTKSYSKVGVPYTFTRDEFFTTEELKEMQQQ